VSGAEQEPSIERLDARGLRCPLPVIKTRERLKERAAGAVLEVVSDDPLVVLDMQAFCAKERHEYLGHDEDPGPVWRLRVRKRS
jgi:tRNA 2-thiouridine synthesizing protein A